MAKIMLVEDDNNLRQIYEDRLAAEGYDIVSAPDGEEALALAVREKPDLIIADIMMPKVSGFDMLDILRSTPETKDCKIIMMTALSQAEDKERAERLGADRYLVKSQVTLEDVANIANEILGNGAPAAAQTPAPAVAPTVAAPIKVATEQSSETSDITPANTPVIAPVEAPAAAAQTPVADDPVRDPIAPPSAATEEPSSAPTVPAPTAAAPASTTIPVIIADDDTPDTSQDTDTKKTETTEVTTEPSSGEPTIEIVPDEASQTETKPLAKEEASAAEKPALPDSTEEFIASNPTLSGSATETKTPSDDNPTNTPGEPSPVDKVASAVDGLMKETESTPGPETNDSNYVSTKTEDNSASMSHTKRIEPISDPSITQAPDLNELLAREAEHTPVQPPVNSVISPGAGGSVNESTVNNTPQVNVEAEKNVPPPDPNPNHDITL